MDQPASFRKDRLAVQHDLIRQHPLGLNKVYHMKERMTLRSRNAQGDINQCRQE
jgi:hypothetical protein